MRECPRPSGEVEKTSLGVDLGRDTILVWTLGKGQREREATMSAQPLLHSSSQLQHEDRMLHPPHGEGDESRPRFDSTGLEEDNASVSPFEDGYENNNLLRMIAEQGEIDLVGYPGQVEVVLYHDTLYVFSYDAKGKRKRMRKVSCHDITAVYFDEKHSNLVVVSFPQVKARCHSFCVPCGKERVHSRERGIDLVLHIAEKSKAEMWRQGIADAVDGATPGKYRVDESNRKMLVIISPTSGRGQGNEIFYESVRPVLDASRIDYQIVRTEVAMHAVRVVAELDLSELSGILVVGGDGMVFEVLQGLHRRVDREKALQIPLGIVPAGSGNGLAASIHHITGEPINDPVSAAFAVARGRTEDLDLWNVTSMVNSAVGPSAVGCLSLTYGFIADLDLESEKWRCLGGARFTAGAIVRTIFLRKYTARLSYLPIETYDIESASGTQSIPPIDKALPETWKTLSGKFILVWALNVTHGASDAIAAPAQKLKSGVIDLLIVRDHSRFKLAKGLLGLETGEHINHEAFETLRVRAFRLEPDVDEVTGPIVVDGEDFSVDAVQVEFLAENAKVFIH